MITQYFSKWRNEWVTFKIPPTAGELNELKKYNYKLLVTLKKLNDTPRNTITPASQ